MIWKKFNLTKYIGFILVYTALSLSRVIDFTIAQYIIFLIGVFLLSLDKEVN